MADQDRQIRLENKTVHVHLVAALRSPQIHHVFPVFRIMADDLAAVPELIIQLRSEDRERVLRFASRMQAVGNNEQNVLLLNAGAVKLLENITDRKLSVTGRLLSAFDSVRYNEDNFRALMYKFRNPRHTDRMRKAFLVRSLQLILRNKRRVCHGFSRNKNVCCIRKICPQRSLSVFKFKVFHVTHPPDDCKVFAALPPKQNSPRFFYMPAFLYLCAISSRETASTCGAFP